MERLKQDRKWPELYRIYRLIHEKGPLTKAFIAEHLNIKPTTLNRLLDRLLRERLIMEKGFDESSGGRPPALYHVNANYGFWAGIDISRTHTRIVLVDMLFHRLAKREFVMTIEHTPFRTVEEISLQLKNLLKESGLSLQKLLGIGVGTVGPLEQSEGMILNPEAFSAPGWQNVPIVQMLKRRFDVPVLLINGAKSAVAGEYFLGEGKENNILYCISGEGLRCGVMTNGQLVQNQTGNVSSYGHMVIDVDGRPCPCGKAGCLNAYISFAAIRKEIRRRERISDRDDGLSVEWIIGRFREKHPVVRKAVLDSAYYYGVGLANMINLLHPDVVILSGALVYELEEYFSMVVRTAKEHIYFMESDFVTFEMGNLRYDAAAIGAAVIMFQKWLESPYDKT